MKNRTTFRDYLQLSKLKIMLPVSLTGFTGYFLFNHHPDAKIVFVSIGVLLMAVAASALNQLQEVDIDRKMKRTHDRPVPAGRINKNQAVIFVICVLLAGTMLIYLSGNIVAVLVGLFTIIWYNGVYTYSKRITAFAVVPGALTGALPPLIGWVAAGGGILDKPIVFLGFLIFVGQIPHFWLLIIKYGEEYSKAGIPSLTDLLTSRQINRLTLVWVITFVIAALFLFYFEVVRTFPVILILLLASIFIIFRFSFLLRSGTPENGTRNYSILLNVYFLLVILLLIADRIIGS